MGKTALGAMLLAFVAAACTSHSTDDPGPCDRAGGRCVLGGNTCVKRLADDDSCNPKANPGGAFCCLDDSADAGAEASSPEASPCPASVPCGCSCPTSDDGGQCVCASSSMPACPASLQSDMGQSCVSGESCMNCSGGVAGIACSCSDAAATGADGGPHWLCIGTGEQCTGGTWHG